MVEENRDVAQAMRSLRRREPPVGTLSLFWEQWQ